MSKKAIVIYNSKRGSTKQYAEWIASGLGCTSVSLENLDYGSLGQFDVVIFGSWLRGSGIVGFDKFRKQITILIETKKKKVRYHRTQPCEIR